MSDATTFTGDPNLDMDGDGWGALLEYAFGSDAGNADSKPGPWTAEARAPGWLVVRFCDEWARGRYSVRGPIV